MFIGLLSDTHGVFDDALRDFLSPVEEIWHAGDFGNIETAKAISAIHPLVGVHGNCDGLDVRDVYPSFVYFERGGMKVLMTHIGGHPGRYDVRAMALIDRFHPELFVCGHSHILRVENDRSLGMMTLNPGACGHQGWQQFRTALRFRIEGGELKDMELLKIGMHP